MSDGTRATQVLRALDAVKAGRISEHEADAYLRAAHGITLERAQSMSDPLAHAREKHTRTLGIASGLLLVMIVAAILLSGTNPAFTGLATVTVGGETTQDTTYAITTPITQLRASGTLTGEGSADFLLDTGTALLRVGGVTSDPGTPRTGRPSYAPGDDVDIDHLPQDASIYLDDGATAMVVSVPFPAPDASAEILIVANESGETATYRIPLVIGDAPRTTAFSGLCEETCTLEPTAGTLIVRVTGEATVQVEATGTAPDVNRAPLVTTPFPPMTITTETRIGLGDHISDPDGDALLYSAGMTGLADLRIDGSTLVITPLGDGTIDLAIYASDLTELLETSIPLTLVAPQPEPTANETEPIPDETEPEANETEPSDPGRIPVVNETEPAVNSTIDLNATIDCSSTDPNLLPVECLLADPQEYFPDEEVFLENLDRTPIAKLNMVGNLLLTGGVVELSPGSPGSRDFVIGSIDRDGNTAAAAWVDTATGDLHLRGHIIEEEISLSPPAGSHSIISRRSIYLAYVDLGTGDLHLRGNVIPYRRSLT